MDLSDVDMRNRSHGKRRGTRPETVSLSGVAGRVAHSGSRGVMIAIVA